MVTTLERKRERSGEKREREREKERKRRERERIEEEREVGREISEIEASLSILSKYSLPPIGFSLSLYLSLSLDSLSSTFSLWALRSSARYSYYTIEQWKEQLKRSPVDAGTSGSIRPTVSGTISVTVTFDTNITQRTAFWSLHVSCHLSRVEEIRVRYSISPAARNFTQEPLWLQVWMHAHKYTHLIH